MFFDGKQNFSACYADPVDLSAPTRRSYDVISYLKRKRPER